MDKLQVHKLKVYYLTRLGAVKAVDGVSFNIVEGETFGIVGESGCGKSTIGLAIMRLIPFPGKIVSGKILLGEDNLVEKSESELIKIRGSKIAICFQDPKTFLNPVMNIGSQIVEALLWHKKANNKLEALEKTLKLLEMVKIPNPENVLFTYPHQLSGGMRQRVILAMALSCDPELLILDEPTTAVDVITQSQIISLLNDLKHKKKMTMLLISHDIGVVSELSNKVGVMYCGEIVECATVRELLTNPRHPYTQGLIESLPEIAEKKTRLKTLKGSLPSLIDTFSGCKFASRCSFSKEICHNVMPEIVDIGNNHLVRCHLFKGGEEL